MVRNIWKITWISWPRRSRVSGWWPSVRPGPCNTSNSGHNCFHTKYNCQKYWIRELRLESNIIIGPATIVSWNFLIFPTWHWWPVTISRGWRPPHARWWALMYHDARWGACGNHARGLYGGHDRPCSSHHLHGVMHRRGDDTDHLPTAPPHLARDRYRAWHEATNCTTTHNNMQQLAVLVNSSCVLNSCVLYTLKIHWCISYVLAEHDDWSNLWGQSGRVHGHLVSEAGVGDRLSDRDARWW